LFYLLYNVLVLTGFILGFPVFLLYCLLTGRHRDGLRERLGFPALPPVTGNGKRLWLHAASVGEVQAARALLPALREELPGATLMVSTMTGQGLQVARSQLGSDVTCFLAPLDLPFAVSRAVHRAKPDLYIDLETELWPNLLLQLKHQGAKIVLLNGRLSERSFGRYRKIAGLTGKALGCFSRIAAIGENDARRFAALGADPAIIEVNGNAKYDRLLPGEGQTADGYRQRLSIAPDQPVLIAGSTRGGEEELLLGTWRQLRQKWPELIFILAPRHIERLAEITALLSAAGESCDLLSELPPRRRRHPIVLVDTLGELAGLYAVGSFIFCGGSLVPRGGHNIMEAAAWGKPVFYGPHMKDFADAKEILETAGAGFEIDSAAGLTAAILSLADHPQAYARAAQGAAAAVRSQAGSARRQARLAASVINYI
jgi:3-deoxy-D-manno-octulosonic-acid transferase